MANPEARVFGVRIFDKWTSLWNLKIELASEIMAPSFVLRYAQPGTEMMDSATSPPHLIEIIRAWHLKRPNIKFKAEGEAAVDLNSDGDTFTGLVARPYSVSFDAEDGRRVVFSGTDVLRISKGHISEVWSVSSGQQGRPFYRELPA